MRVFLNMGGKVKPRIVQAYVQMMTLVDVW